MTAGLVRAAVRAEFTKIVSLWSVRVFTAVILALHVFLSIVNSPMTAASVAGITAAGMIEMFPGDLEPARPALLEFLVASSFQMCLFLPALAAVIAGQEFRGPQLGQSLLAVPRRGLLLAAKVVATAGYLALVAVVLATVSGIALFAAARDWDPGLAVGADAWRAQSTFLAYAVLTGLIGLTLGLLARSALAGILLTVGLTALTMTQLPLLFAPALDALLPLSAGRNLLLNPAVNDLTASPGHAWAVVIAWPLVTGAAAGIRLARRDAW